MSDPADTGTSRDGDPYAEIAALRQRVAELERELGAARKVCEELDWVPLHNPPSDGLESALAAYRATQTKEQDNEKAE